MCKHEPFLVRHMIYNTIIINVWLFKIIFIEERKREICPVTLQLKSAV